MLLLLIASILLQLMWRVASDVTIVVSIEAGTSHSNCDTVSSDDAVWGAKYYPLHDKFSLFRGSGYNCPNRVPPLNLQTLNFACNAQQTDFTVCLVAGDDDRFDITCSGVLGGLDEGDLGCKIANCAAFNFAICPIGTVNCAKVQDYTTFNLNGGHGVSTSGVRFRISRTGTCATNSPTRFPSRSPSKSPTRFPTESPSKNPSTAPSLSPTFSPTRTPTQNPTNTPTYTPTQAPTWSPTLSPTTIDNTRPPTAFPFTFSPTRSPLPCVGELQVCGGLGWLGPTCCRPGFQCQVLSAAQSICRQQISNTPPTNSPVETTTNSGTDSSKNNSMFETLSDSIIFIVIGAVVIILALCFISSFVGGNKKKLHTKEFEKNKEKSGYRESARKDDKLMWSEFSQEASFAADDESAEKIIIHLGKEDINANVHESELKLPELLKAEDGWSRVTSNKDI